MSIIEYLIVVFFILLAFYTGIGLLRSIVKNSQQGIVFRNKLMERVKSERIHEMLQSLGIAPEHYIHATRVNEIEIHINRCQACANTEQCDRELLEGLTSAVESYCPNNGDLLNTPVKSTPA